MQKLIKFFKKNLLLILVLVLTIPTFWKMLPAGMYSTQDFHIFRLVEFDKCIKSLQIPCRWAPDAGLGFGEPLFNFYGQFTYSIGEIYHLLGGSFINSTKFLFVLSLAGSAVSMYFLAKRIWKSNFSGVISSVIYLYAPYRSVDVWVRGALPEAFAFILFPLIILFIDKYIEEKKISDLLLFTLLLGVLIITHNLSLIMFAPLLIVWTIFKLCRTENWKAIIPIIISLVGTFLLTAFYILPVAFESKFIDLGSTIIGYFDFHNHFVTSHELFISNFWGYGASVWGPVDGLSLAIGYVQWILPIIILLVLFYKFIFRRDKKSITNNLPFIILFIMGWFYIFLTHNKSTIIWEHLPFMTYIQFPWRFLGMVVFCFSLSSGLIVKFFGKGKVFPVIIICAASIILNTQFFRPDIWYKVTDSYYLTGTEWIRQRTASIGDFWPNFGHKIPTLPSDGTYINYFPGWISKIPEKDGLILSKGSVFTDTPIRKIGNIISGISFLGFLAFVFSKKKWEKRI